MRFLPALSFVALAAIAAPAVGAPARHGVAPARNAEYLSFAELYRMTVGGVSVVEFTDGPVSEPAQSPAPFPDYQVRVASAEATTVQSAAAAAPARYSFSTPVLPEPTSRWLLLLSGLAVAAWVARRRLGYSL